VSVELENMIERAVVMTETEELVPENFPRRIFEKSKQGRQIEDIFNGFSIKAGKEILERNLIQRALEATSGNRTKASRLLEISHPSLLSKIKTYDIFSGE